MKKLISLLVVFAMLMTMAPTAFAATGNNSQELLPNAYEGAGTITDPWIVDELPTTLEGTFDANADHFYRFTATQAGTIDLGDFSGCMVIAYLNAEPVSEEYEDGETEYYFDAEFAEFPIEVAAGDHVDINLFGFGAGDYSAELSFEASEPEVVGTITSGRWTMSLDSVVYLNYYPTLTGFSEGFDFATRGGVVVWAAETAPTSRYDLYVGSENCNVINGMKQNEEGEWYVQTHEIFAKNLGDKVYIRPFVEVNGEYIYQEGAPNYSPAAYCYDILNNANEREDTRYVCAALLTYGAAAQTTFGYKTDALVTDGIDLSAYDLSFKEEYINALPTAATIDQYIKDLAAAYAADNGTKAGITAKYQNLSLEGAIRMTTAFTIDTSVIDLANVDTMQVLFWNESEMFDLTALTARNAYAADLVFDGEEYKAVSDHILAKNLGETVYFTARIVMNDGTIYRTGMLYLSVENWLHSEIQGNTANAEISKVIAVYGEMARIRFAENEEPACEHETTYTEFDYEAYDDGNADLVEYCEACGEEVARYAPGTIEENPYFIYNFEYSEDGSSVSFAKELPAGITYFAAYNVGGMVLTVTDAEGNVISTETLPTAWRGMPVYFQVNAQEAGTYTLTFTYPLGSMMNPDTLKEEGNTVEVPANNADGYVLSWTAPADGTLTITVEGENWTYVVNNMTTYVYGENMFACYGDSNVTTVEVAEGNEIQVIVSTMDENYNYPGGTITVSMEFTPAAVEEPENLLVLGENTLTSGVEYTYVAPADGRLEFKVNKMTDDTTGSRVWSLNATRLQILIDGKPMTSTTGRCNVTAGQRVTVQVVSVDGDAYTVIMNLAEVEAAQSLQLGDNNLAQDLEYVYIAEQDGTLYLSIKELLYDGAACGEDDLSNTVYFKVNGSYVSSFDSSYEVKAGDEIAVVLSVAWSGSTSAVLYLSYEGFYEHPAGSIANPVPLLYADCPTNTIEIAAGTAVWYELESYYDEEAWSTVYPFAKKNLVVTGENAYVIVDGTRYDAVDGVVTVLMNSTTLIQIGNDGEEAATFALSVVIPEGHEENPMDLVPGDNVVTVPSYGSFYYDFVAPSDGIVTLVVSGENWRARFAHYDAEGNELSKEERYAKNSDSDTFVVEMKAGETVVLNLGTSKGYSQPGGELTVNLSFVPMLADGQYVISYGDHTFQALGASKNYGYAPGGDINDLTDADIFTVTNVGGGKFTLTDCYGRLVYMTGTYNSFNVTSDPTSVTEGHEWVLEMAEDGKFYIKNVLKGKYISYTASYGTFGSYTNPGTNSILDVTPYIPLPDVESTLVLGNNELIVDAGIAEDARVYVVERTGTLYIKVRSYFSGNSNWGEDMLRYPDWSCITINGETITSFSESIEVTRGDLVYITLVNGDDCAYSADVYLSFEGFYEEPAGSEFNPVVLAPSDCPTDTIVIPAGETVFYNLDYDFSGYTLYVYGENAYIVTYVFNYETYENVPTVIEAVNGVVTFPVNYYDGIQIGNAGDTDATFRLEAFVPVGAEKNPDELVEGDNEATLLAGSDGYYYTWTAEADGIVTITVTGENWMYYVENPGDPEVWSDDLVYSDAVAYGGTNNVVVVPVKAGDELSVSVRILDPATYEYAAGTLTVTMEFDTVGGTLAQGDNTLSVDATVPSVLYTYTAEEDGYLYLTAAQLLEDGAECDISYLEEYCSLYINGVKVTNSDPVILNVYTGDLVAVKFVCEDVEYAYELVLNLTYGAIPSAPLELGHSSLTAGDGSGNYAESAYTYTAEQTGTLYLTVRSWSFDMGWGATEMGEEIFSNYYGVSFIWIDDEYITSLKYELNVTEGEEVTFLLTSDYGALITADIYLSFEGYYVEPLGSQKNPVALSAADLPCETVEIEAGASVWYQLSDEFWGTTLVINSEDVYVTVTYYDNFEWTNVTKYYYAEDGKVEMLVEYGTLIQIVNVGDTAATFSMEMSGEVEYGTELNPQALLMGDNEVALEEYNSGYYFTWTAEEAGTLTITVTGDANWRFMVYNATTGEGGDIMMDWYGDSNTYSLEVAAGDEVMIIVTTYGDKEANDEWATPAGNYIVNAVFTAVEAAPDVG